MKTIDGYDYKTQTALSLTRRDWRERAQPILAAGGFVKRVCAETFVHDARARIVMEIYDYVSIVKEAPDGDGDDDGAAQS